MDAVDAPVKVGDILAGKYRVEKVLGMGAMGVVVAAMHVDLQEMRAIKFMLPSMLGDTEGVERFMREARAVVRLKSQHVARVNDVGRLETGAPYIVMEYLQGTDLKQLLEARGTLPVTEAVRYMVQACEAIAEAHALGIVHRDLKPANLFVTTGPTGAPCVKVLDFGIAKVSGAGQAMDMTRTSELLGTPLYMSPEQMRSTRNVDARSDIWALGVILYRMLTGRTPFTGSTVTEICSAVIADQPDPPAMLRSGLPPALEAVVMRCLEKSPAKRFATTVELQAALAPFGEERAVSQIVPAAGGLGQTVAMDPHASAPAPTAPRGSLPSVPQPPPAAPLAPSAVPSTRAPQPWATAAPAPTFPPAPTPLPGPTPLPATASLTASAAPRPPLDGAVTMDPPATAPGPIPGHSTARSSTWTQSGTAPPATPRSSSRGALVVIAAAAVALIGGVAFVAVRMMASSAPAAASAPAATAATEASSTAPAAAPRAAATASAGPTADVSAVPAAASAAPSASAAAPSALPGRALKAPPHASPPRRTGPKSDAFGNERR
jgi:serine/threonine-protein kinase